MNKRKKQEPQQDLNNLGKLQPQATELEEAVLGALLLEKNAYQVIDNIISVEDFYSDKHKAVFSAILSLINKREPVDIMTVHQELTRSGEIDELGGPMYIAGLTEKVASSAHIEYHARIIAQKAIARRIIESATEIQRMAYDETQDVSETLEYFEKALSTVQPKNSNNQSLVMADAVRKALDAAGERQAQLSRGEIPCIPTHLDSLTRALDGGWRQPDLIIIGARPSMGKTQHALSIAKSAAMHGSAVGFFSIEMNTEQLVNRYLLEDDRIDTRNLLSGQLSNEEWIAIDEQAGKLYDLPIHILDHHSIRYLSNIKSEARRLKRKNNLSLLIIDYLGLIRTNMKFERRQLEIAHITSELKSLAKELGIPIIALSQLSRPEKGGKVRAPRLEDLRESGDIEQDADIVLFIHKPDYYEPDLKEWSGLGMLIISKYRNGERNNVIQFAHDNRYKKIFDPTGFVPSIDNVPF